MSQTPVSLVSADGSRKVTLARYACFAEQTRGRLILEPEDPDRSPFERDRDRIIHSAAFRKLQYKTQVFIVREGDYYRTRLTHTLEVAQIARSIAAALDLDQPLAEAIALAHDLGHTPFGHTGEDAMSACLKQFDLPAFDHNDQSFRILTQLEARYAAFDGLNLTWDTLEGVAKHNGPLTEQTAQSITAFDRKMSLDLDGFASLEAQSAALADDIAYNNHDVEDGLRAGLFALEDLRAIPVLERLIAEVRSAYPALDDKRVGSEVIRRMIGVTVRDVIACARARLAAFPQASCAAVRKHDKAIIRFSPEMAENIRLLRHFLLTRMYRHYQINRVRAKAKRVIEQLFWFYLESPSCLPDEWRIQAEAMREKERVRLVTDYIAGMTDHYALREHALLFENNFTPQNPLAW